eukprot:2653638-Pyramimonas_sp.AAC.1
MKSQARARLACKMRGNIRRERGSWLHCETHAGAVVVVICGQQPSLSYVVFPDENRVRQGEPHQMKNNGHQRGMDHQYVFVSSESSAATTTV